MDRMELFKVIMQADSEDFAQVMENYFVAMERFCMIETMAEEVQQLCGPSHQRGNDSEFTRAGSAPGGFFGRKEYRDILRPRVRRKEQDGTSSEVRLKTYEAGRNAGMLRKAIFDAMVCGVPSRKVRRAMGTERFASKSEVSRLWQQKGAEYLEKLRGRNISLEKFVVLMLDGVVLSNDLTAVVALGITEKGEKQMLDFEIGSSESNEVCCALTDRLVHRGIRFAAANKPLAILDGAQALRNAVRRHWPLAEVQTCLVHVARNVTKRLAKKWKTEFERLFNLLRKASSLEAATEAYETTLGYVARHSAEGVKILENAREEMLTLFRLGVPDTLNRSLLSTNSIENSINNMRRLLGRVKRWRGETDMASLWMATAMLEAESGFHRIAGYSDLPHLVAALKTAAFREKKNEGKTKVKKQNV